MEPYHPASFRYSNSCLSRYTLLNGYWVGSGFCQFNVRSFPVQLSKVDGFLSSIPSAIN